MNERVYALALCSAWGTVLGPHGIKRRYLLLNRRYLPWATGLTRIVDYDDCPGTRVWLDDKFLHQIDGAIDGAYPPYRPGDSRCWLYGDRSKPRHAAYHRRFLMLMDEMRTTHDFPVGVVHSSTVISAEAR